MSPSYLKDITLKLSVISVIKYPSVLGNQNKSVLHQNSNVSATLVICQYYYRSGTVNLKSFVGKVLLRIKLKFELIYAL